MKPYGLLGCPCCAKAACILTVVIIVGGLALLWWVGRVLAAPGVALEACSRATCEKPSEKVQDALGGSGSVTIQSGSVIAVGGVSECPKCAKVVLDRGREFLVLGTPEDVSCRLFGGSACKSK